MIHWTNKGKTIKGFHRQDFPFVVFKLSFCPSFNYCDRTQRLQRPEFLIKLFLGEMNAGWMESLNSTGRKKCMRRDAVCCEMKRPAFSCSFKTFNSPWKDMTSILAKTQGRNECYYCRCLNINHAQYFEKKQNKKQCIFVCISEVTNNTCDWLNVVNSHYSKPEANQN